MARAREERGTNGSRFLDEASGRAERPHLAFDDYDIMQDAINKYKEVTEYSGQMEVE